MMRIWMLLLGVAMMSALSGCGSDLKELAVTQEMSLMDNTTQKVAELTKKVTTATEKLVADKELDLADSVKACEELKKFCKDQVQKKALELQTMRLNLTSEQKKEYDAKFTVSLNKKVLDSNEKRKELYLAFTKLESTVKTLNFSAEAKRDEASKAIENLKKVYSEAEGEFESLCRRS